MNQAPPLDPDAVLHDCGQAIAHVRAAARQYHPHTDERARLDNARLLMEQVRDDLLRPPPYLPAAPLRPDVPEPASLHDAAYPHA